MALQIANREQEGIEILDLNGRLVLGAEDQALRQGISNAVSAGRNRVVLDFGKVTDVDTTGVGTLSLFHESLRKAGGGLALANLRPAHMELLIVAKLNTTFEIFEDDQDAINSFFPERYLRRYDILEFIESRRRNQAKPAPTPKP